MSRPRPRPRAPYAALIAIVLVGSGCSALGIGGEQLAAGDAVRAATDQPPAGTPAADDGWTAELQLPDGRLTARVAPLDEDDVPAEDTFEDQAFSIDGDATLVAVSWSLDQLVGVPFVAQSAVLDAGSVDDTVALVSGESRIPVDVEGLDHTGGFAYAAVPATDDLRLEVVFDGVAQSIGADSDAPHVDDAAQALYDPVGDGRAFTACRTTTSPASLKRTASCRARSAAWPWVSGLGWAENSGAEKSGAWQLVDLETSLGGADAAVTDTVVEANLDGAQPSAELSQSTDRQTTSALLAFPAGQRLQVSRTSTVDGADATMTGTLRLGS